MKVYTIAHDSPNGVRVFTGWVKYEENVRQYLPEFSWLLGAERVRGFIYTNEEVVKEEYRRVLEFFSTQGKFWDIPVPDNLRITEGSYVHEESSTR
jgi:hypothetical protein